jgi:hypothetical protein
MALRHRAQSHNGLRQICEGTRMAKADHDLEGVEKGEMIERGGREIKEEREEETQMTRWGRRRGHVGASEPLDI